MKLKHISIVFATTGTIFLYFLSTLVQPCAINLEEISNYDGKQISTIGTVTDYYETQYGNQIITINRNNSTAVVFLEKPMLVEYGDEISVMGQVQKYKEAWEIIVENEKAVKILQKWSNISLPIRYLAQNPVRYLGLNVNITGQIDAVFEEYLQIKDKENNNTLIVFINTNPFLYKGKEVFVLGKFLFDEETFRYFLVVSEDNHGIFLKTEDQF